MGLCPEDDMKCKEEVANNINAATGTVGPFVLSSLAIPADIICRNKDMKLTMASSNFLGKQLRAAADIVGKKDEFDSFTRKSVYYQAKAGLVMHDFFYKNVPKSLLELINSELETRTKSK